MIVLANFRRVLAFIIYCISTIFCIQAQTVKDSLENKKWNFHFQNTVIYQYHPVFKSNYSGVNSLNPNEEKATSLSGTIYLGAKLWKGATAYWNTEISGGSGFSKTLGIAGFPNGEVYRVIDVSPKVYTARLFVKQLFALSDQYESAPDGINQLPTRVPTHYFAVSAGKFSILDFLDNNKFSHDPRTQFYNWALMGNGAWDYPADTRGFTYGIVTELVNPEWALRFAAVMVPTTANGMVLDGNVLRSRSEAFEFEHKYKVAHQSGSIRLMTFLTEARMGSYKRAIEWGEAQHTAPEIDKTNALGRTKYGFGINVEHNFSDDIGAFFRASWSDGHNETWAFTEIDRAISAGFQLNGNRWKRIQDKAGFALMVNGLSNEHQNYLKAGGSGFIIGDGNLNYQTEMIAEGYYSLKLKDYPLWISPDYQFIINPAYNRDRGPVNAFGIRVHVEI